MHPDWAHSPYSHTVGNVRPWLNPGDHIAKHTHIGPDGFQVSLDVQHFTPADINVTTIDGFIEIEAKHDDRPDELGHVARQFRRRYRLPDGFRAEDVVASFSSDAILTVKVPPEVPELKGRKVRHVIIQQTGPARLNVAEKTGTAVVNVAVGTK